MKILVIRFSSIGDIVLTSPIVRCLSKQLHAEVHFLTKKSFGPLVNHNPYLSKVFLLDDSFQTILPALKEEKYDQIIDLHNNLRTRRLKFQLGRPASSFPKLNFEKWLLVQTGINQLPNIHIVDRYFQAVKHLNVHYDNAGLDYFFSKKDAVNLAAYPTLHQRPFTAFVIGAAHATKQIPLSKVLDFCKKIDNPIALIGGQNEKALGYKIQSHFPDKIINLAGALSLHGSASIIQQAAEVITPDTGMMHIAAAFQKKIISVWGNTVPAFGMTPFYAKGKENNTTLEVQNLNCRPCSKIGFATCPKGHFKCMKEIVF